MYTKILMLLFLAGFLLVPVCAVKSAEESLGGSITRGSRFTVTITGLPNSSYYIWIPHTSTMSGEPHDQPPVIAGAQADIRQDPPEGPWPIGSYRFNNGGGTTIREDIPPSTGDFPNTRYYALVTTDYNGQATVEFLTSFNTALRSFSVRVENPRSVDSDNLLVELHTYSRSAPAPLVILTTAQPVTTLSSQTATSTIPSPSVTTTPAPTLPETTSAGPAQPATPVQTRTQKTPISNGIVILSLCAGLLLIRR